MSSIQLRARILELKATTFVLCVIEYVCVRHRMKKDILYARAVLMEVYTEK